MEKMGALTTKSTPENLNPGKLFDWLNSFQGNHNGELTFIFQIFLLHSVIFAFNYLEFYFFIKSFKNLKFYFFPIPII